MDDTESISDQYSDDERYAERRGVGLEPEKHLTSAILVSLLDRVETLYKEAKGRIMDRPQPLRTTRAIQAIADEILRDPKKGYSHIRQPLMQYVHLRGSVAKAKPGRLEADVYPRLFALSDQTRDTFLTWDLETARDIYHREVAAYMEWVSDIVKPAEAERYKASIAASFVPTVHTKRAFRSMLFWEDVVDKYRATYCTMQDKTVKHNVGDWTFHMGKGFVLVVHGDEQWLATYEQLQMIQDCCMARYNVEVALLLNFHNGTPALEGLYRRIVAWQEGCLTRYANRGYELVKAPEAVFKSLLTTLTDGDVLPDSTLNRTLRKLAAKERKFSESTPQVDAMRRIVADTKEISDAAELFGLAKLSGHPTVYARNSALFLRENAARPPQVVMNSVFELERCAKHLVLEGYLNVHSVFPPMQSGPPSGSELERLMRNQVTTLPLGSYPLTDTDTVKFSQFMDFDMEADFMSYIDDRAISPGARTAGSFWFGTEAPPRRLLHNVLEQEEIDVPAIIHRLRKGRYTKDELIVELNQKEREFKMGARCYGKLHPNVRMYMVVVTHNMKEFVKKYVPQLTSAMGDAETKRRLDSLARLGGPNECRVEVDFSSWNGRWADVTTGPIARMMNDIFGLHGVFSQANYFFFRATLMITDKHTLPPGASPNKPVWEWPESDILWRRRHRGGVEGLSQEFWAFCTVAMMTYCLHGEEISLKTAGQGDNHIYTLTFDVTHEPMANQLARLLAGLEVRAAALNHEVKPEECIDSRTVITYSKELYVNGHHVPYCLKFAARSFRREDSEIPSLAKDVASVYSNTLACTDNLNEPIRALAWKSFQFVSLLRSRFNSRLYPPEKPYLRRLLRSSDCCAFAALVPGSLGGLPTQPWTRFFCKGDVDDLSWDVAAVARLARRDDVLSADLALVARGEYTPKRHDVTRLLEDPSSIPLARPTDSTELIKKHVKATLLSHTRNRMIRDVLSNGRDAAYEKLSKALAAARPMYPDVLADLREFTVTGVAERLYGRFVMTRTIRQLTGSTKFAEDIKRAGGKLLASVLRRYDAARATHVRLELNLKPFEICTKLRQLWDPPVDNTCIGQYTPWDFDLRYDDGTDGILAIGRAPSQSLFTTRGPYQPYFGSNTKAKTAKHGFTVKESTSTVRDLKKLVALVSSLDADKSIIAIADNIAKTRCPWSIGELFAWFPTNYGGAAVHRYERLGRGGYSAIGNKSALTHVGFSSDRSGSLSGGIYDYPIVFQAMYLTMSCLYTQLAANGCVALSARLLLALPVTPLRPIPDAPTTTDVVVPQLKRASPWNRLAYVTKLGFTQLPHAMDARLVPMIDFKTRPVIERVYSYLLAKLAPRVRDLATRGVERLPVDLFDVKEFSRIPLALFIRGCALFLLAISVHRMVRLRKVGTRVRVRDVLTTLAEGVGARVVRLFLHPSEQNTRFVQTLGLVLRPGLPGSSQASRNMAAHLCDVAWTMFTARDKSIMRTGLIFTSDCRDWMVAALDIHAHLLLSFQSPDPNRFVLTRQQLDILEDLRGEHSRLMNRPATTHRYLSAFQAIRAGLSSSARATGTPPLHLYQALTSMDEGMRAFRECGRDPRAPRVLDHYPTDGLGRRFESSYTRRDASGSYRTRCSCRERPTHRACRRVLNLAVRPVGRYTTTLSFWLPILRAMSVYEERVYSLGVGHGGVARAAALAGAAEVIGVDLASSVPLVAQREGAYVPPEVVNTPGLVFTFSPVVWKTGGDLTNEETLSELSARLDGEPVVIDLDGALVDAAIIASRLTNRFSRTAMRGRACEHELKAVLSCTADAKVYRVSASERAAVGDWVVVATGWVSPIASANEMRIDLGVSVSANGRFPGYHSDIANEMAEIVRETGIPLGGPRVTHLAVWAKLARAAAAQHDNQIAARALLSIANIVEGIADRVTEGPLVDCIEHAGYPRWAERLLGRALAVSRTPAHMYERLQRCTADALLRL